MQRLAHLTLIFAIVFAVFIITPAFLSGQFALYPLLKNGDVLDLLTSLVLIPLYWLLFQIHPRRSPNQKEMLVFLLFAALWVEGQGMHLVANSIGHLTSADSGSEVQQLTHFYDEILSHYIWHFGLAGLSALLIYRQWQNPFIKQRSGLKFEITAGIIHGFNYFIDVVESATTILGVPFAVGVVIFTLIWGRQHLRQQPILAFFFVSYLIACLFFLGWGLYWGGLPEFSEVGIID
ncbi:hypothetical protein [Pleurocapsa sp. PCC 7319]|uniref:hypothetical protein n=1 Tax=Pleurocapsa sp. PCC 7319 TaxID=118161 RepID=UPI00034CB148|nr:hypothetical protein [Pleurocapsa sp. PCC 7319]